MHTLSWSSYHWLKNPVQFISAHRNSQHSGAEAFNGNWTEQEFDEKGIKEKHFGSNKRKKKIPLGAANLLLNPASFTVYISKISTLLLFTVYRCSLQCITVLYSISLFFTVYRCYLQYIAKLAIHATPLVFPYSPARSQDPCCFIFPHVLFESGLKSDKTFFSEVRALCSPSSQRTDAKT